jgi:hypothetical protein
MFLNHRKTMTLEDRDAHKATQISKMTIKANRNGVQRFRVGEVRAEGPIKDILVDGQPPATEKKLHAIEVFKVFDPPLGRGEERDMEVSLIFEDSYKKSSEMWAHPIAIKTDKLTVKLVFPSDRKCGHAWATASFNGEVFEWMSGQVKVSRDRREATLEVPKPRLGAAYELHWEW